MKFCLGMGKHFIMHLNAYTTEPLDHSDIQFSDEIPFTIDMLFHSSHTKVIKLEKGTPIGLI